MHVCTCCLPPNTRYGPLYVWAQLSSWYKQTVYDPTASLSAERRGTLSLPDIESCYNTKEKYDARVSEGRGCSALHALLTKTAALIGVRLCLGPLAVGFAGLLCVWPASEGPPAQLDKQTTAGGSHAQDPCPAGNYG